MIGFLTKIPALVSRIPFLGYVALLGWATAAAAGWLYKEQVELTERVRAGCEVELYKAALETAAEQMQRQAEIHQNWRIRMQEQVAAESIAKERAEIIAGEAIERLRESQEALGRAEDACLDNPADTDLIVSLQ